VWCARVCKLGLTLKSISRNTGTFRYVSCLYIYTCIYGITKVVYKYSLYVFYVIYVHINVWCARVRKLGFTLKSISCNTGTFLYVSCLCIYTCIYGITDVVYKYSLYVFYVIYVHINVWCARVRKLGLTLKSISRNTGTFCYVFCFYIYICIYGITNVVYKYSLYLFYGVFVHINVCGVHVLGLTRQNSREKHRYISL